LGTIARNLRLGSDGGGLAHTREVDRNELPERYTPDKTGADSDWGLLAESWLSTTQKAVVHIAHGCAILGTPWWRIARWTSRAGTRNRRINHRMTAADRS
jgi:hypothetical protein